MLRQGEKLEMLEEKKTQELSNNRRPTEGSNLSDLGMEFHFPGYLMK